MRENERRGEERIGYGNVATMCGASKFKFFLGFLGMYRQAYIRVGVTGT